MKKYAKMNLSMGKNLFFAVIGILFSLVFLNLTPIAFAQGGAETQCPTGESLSCDISGCQCIKATGGAETQCPAGQSLSCDISGCQCVSNGSSGTTGGGGSPGTSQVGGGGQPVGGGGTPGELQNFLSANTFQDLITNVIGFLQKLLIPISTIMIIYAGYLFLTSSGNPEKLKSARQALFWAVVGIAIILIGSGITLVIKDVIGVKQ